MEIKSGEFLEAVKNLLDLDKKVVVVTDQFRYKSSLLINLCLENREKVN